MYMIQIKDLAGKTGYAFDLLNGQYSVVDDTKIDACAVFKSAQDALMVANTFIDDDGQMNGNLAGNWLYNVNGAIIIQVVKMTPKPVSGMSLSGRK